MATIKKMAKAQAGKKIAGEMTGKMYKKSAIDKIGDKQAAELDKSGVYGKAAMAKKKKMKMGGTVKAKDGKSFPDLNKDGKITKADILKGRGVIAKKGAKVMPCASCGKKMSKKK